MYISRKTAITIAIMMLVFGWLSAITYLALDKPVVGDPIGVSDTHLEVPASITGATPYQVCKNHDSWGKSEALVGPPVWVAIWQGYKLTYRQGDSNFGFFYGTAADYPPVDEKTLKCLDGAPLGLPE